MKKFVSFFSIALAGLMLFSGCSQAASVPESQLLAQSDSETNQSTRQLTPLQASDGTSYGGVSEQGLYIVSPAVNVDGSTNLMYLDFNTKQKIVLCSQPNCTHSTDSCTGYLSYSAGGIAVEVVGEDVILFFLGNVYTSQSEQDTVLPHIEIMKMDASERRTTLTLEANQSVNRPMVTDGTFLYCERMTATEDKITSDLVQIDPVNGELTVLRKLNQEWVKGGAGSKLILMNADGDYFTYDIDTKQEENIYEETDPWVSTRLFGSILVYKQNQRFCAYNVLTGTTTEWSSYAAPTNEEATITFLDADEKHLIFSIRSDSNQTGTALADGFYVLQGESEPQPWALTYLLDNEATAIDHIANMDADTFLVITGVSMPNDSVSGNSGYIVTGENFYATISAKDYWQGNAVYVNLAG